MAKDYRETLYTVDEQGRRNWVYNSVVFGKFFKLRTVVAYLLLSFYLLMPWISINNKQGILLDFAERRFIFFGAEFWATDTQFLFLVLGTLAFSLFFFTAVFGRIWCGWACPETIFLEFLFKPIERLIEGNAAQRRKLDKQPWNFEKIRKKTLKHFFSASASWVIASTALAYFIGREPLLNMMQHTPTENFGPFSMTLVLMGLMAFQFGWFREQFCTVLCPYARFQSVLMDSESIVVGYDVTRGEPRGKAKDEKTGDCVDCGLCVRVCPTGIDIRNGLQLECIACTACIDACDSIMKKVGKDVGLVRYDTENRLLGRSTVRKIFRIRPIIYAILICVFVGSFAYLLKTRTLSEFQVLRGGLDKPFTILADGRISNHLHARISNKSDSTSQYKLSLVEERSFELITPINPFPVEAKQIKTTPVFINFNKNQLSKGKYKIKIKIESKNYVEVREVTLLGPEK